MLLWSLFGFSRLCFLLLLGLGILFEVVDLGIARPCHLERLSFVAAEVELLVGLSVKSLHDISAPSLALSEVELVGKAILQGVLLLNEHLWSPKVVDWFLEVVTTSEVECVARGQEIDVLLVS